MESGDLVGPDRGEFSFDTHYGASADGRAAVLALSFDRNSFALSGGLQDFLDLFQRRSSARDFIFHLSADRLADRRFTRNARRVILVQPIFRVDRVFPERDGRTDSSHSGFFTAVARNAIVELGEMEVGILIDRQWTF